VLHRLLEDVRNDQHDLSHFAEAIAAFAITAAFGSAGFAAEFTVREGKRYRATLSLNTVERLADNDLIASRFRALGFTKVRVSGAGAIRRVEGHVRMPARYCLVRSLRLLNCKMVK
jgi:hypothetical protein